VGERNTILGRKSMQKKIPLIARAVDFDNRRFIIINEKLGYTLLFIDGMGWGLLIYLLIT